MDERKGVDEIMADSINLMLDELIDDFKWTYDLIRRHAKGMSADDKKELYKIGTKYFGEKL